MKVKVIRTIDELSDVRFEWINNVSNVKEVSVYDSYYYNLVWWDSIGSNENNQLFVVAIYDNNSSLVALVPCKIKIHKSFGVKIRTLLFLSNGDTHSPIFFNEKMNKNKIFNVFFSTLEDCRNEFDKVCLSHIDVSSSFAKYILKHQKLNAMFSLITENPVLDKQNFDSFDEYKKIYLSKNVKNLKNRFQKEVGYTFKVEKVDCIDRFASIHIEQQAKESRTNRMSLFSDKHRLDFVNNLYKSGEHYVFMIETPNDGVVAYQAVYQMEGVLYFWNMGYDLRYSNYSLGRISIYSMLEWFFNQEIFYKLDFGSGRYPWKFQWTSELSSIYKLEYFVNSSRKITLYRRMQGVKKGISCLLSSFKL